MLLKSYFQIVIRVTIQQELEVSYVFNNPPTLYVHSTCYRSAVPIFICTV